MLHIYYIYLVIPLLSFATHFFLLSLCFLLKSIFFRLISIPLTIDWENKKNVTGKDEDVVFDKFASRNWCACRCLNSLSPSCCISSELLPACHFPCTLRF